ncbi:MBL fold metallo-hydrolase [Myxococcota bacterium]|nr:MBL fold metallo-hydrolase [Myxococcota bacterium]MBU1381536.1 MBL fold metallo-hydrolase [Myxococcota bacterium]MBU1497411.1 MBL fold metallo-hydrolase [Myxococcota bacterium]
MSGKYTVNTDFVEVFEKVIDKNEEKYKFVHTLAWGDFFDIVETSVDHIKIDSVKYIEQVNGTIKPEEFTGYIKLNKDEQKLSPDEIYILKEQSEVLKLNFIDVQQGDASVIETADGKVILVDGGDNQLFARYLAGRYRDTSPTDPKNIDCIIVTHGDSDHFSGLAKIEQSTRHQKKYKRIFISPKRVFHNGIIKRKSDHPSVKAGVETLLGKMDSEGFLTSIYDSLLSVPDSEMNSEFLKWKRALEKWDTDAAIEFRAIHSSDADAFSFFNTNDLKIDILGPIRSDKGNTKRLRAFTSSNKTKKDGYMNMNCHSSHTINGHSVVFRLKYRNFSCLFTGDLNAESSSFLLDNLKDSCFSSTVLKVPHHGSGDFDNNFLKAVSPAISIISSGDEETRKEYIHPRANLVSALGRYSSSETPLIFITELVAFFKKEGESIKKEDLKKDPSERTEFFGFSRSAYGSVKIRTNGKRLLVYTNSGKNRMKEAYCFSIDAKGQLTPEEIRKI